MTEWISVKDRLPDPYVFVLVFEFIKDQPSPMSIARWERDRWNGLGDQEDGSEYNAFWIDLFWGIDWANITHWMPLPEAPNE